MSTKDIKPEVSIDLVKDVVKKIKSKGLDNLAHHDLAVALSTIGFREVCKQFGTQWTEKIQKQAISKLSNSEYDLSWIGRVNNPNHLPFLQLCIRGDIQKVKQFIFTVGKKAKVELAATTDNFKRTALHLAVKQGFDVLAEYLIGEGFSLTARDRQLKTPLHYCKSELLCQILLKRGANVTLKDNKNCNVAHYAASGSDFKSLQIILKKTNVVNEVDATLKTPIFYAIFNGTQQQINIIRILLQNGANVNDQDSSGKTPLHYAAQMVRTRCIPFLLQKGAKIDIRDKSGKTPLQLSSNQKVKKLFSAYCQSKGVPSQKEQKQKRVQLSKIFDNTSKENKSKLVKQAQKSSVKTNPQIYTKEVNQVSTWIRQKFFVLMKKLQESGIKSLWHLKRPYIYTGSWAEDIESLGDLYQTFLNVSGPEAAMRAFNILCPYQKPLPTVLGKSEQAFQSFFGQNWFSNDPIEKVKNMHSQSKIRNELQLRMKQNQDLKTQLMNYRSQIQKLQANIMNQKDEMNHYSSVEQELRKQRTKSTQQYAQILKYINQISNLKEQIAQLNSGQQRTQILSNMVQQLRSKNEDLQKQISLIKVNEAAARRKCGQLFLKSLSMAKNGQSLQSSQDCNLYDDDAIINLYQLLKNNPPNLQKRFKLADKRGTGKLNIQEFTKVMQNLAMLPQDVMSMHRITGFAHGRKTLSLQQFKTILQNRHKNRPMWQKQLIRKLKNIILSQNITLDQFFNIVDKDGSGSIQPAELRKGLEDCNIFMNQNDWSNLFNLLDADKSGTIDLDQLKSLFQQQKTGKLQAIGSVINKKSQKEEVSQSNRDKQSQQNNLQVQNQSHKAQNQEQKQPSQNQQENKQEQNEPEPLQEQEQQDNQEVQKLQNELLSNSEEFKSEYQQKDSEAEAGIKKINGTIKAQVPHLKNVQLDEQDSQKVYIKFAIAEFQMIKMADLTLPKLAIVIKFQMTEYKIMDPSELKLHISVFKTRTFDESTYLGEFVVQLQQMLNKPNQWIVNNQYALQASQYDKQVSGSMVLQVKWIPSEDQ